MVLLETVLTDVSARPADKLPVVAASNADDFLPWGSIASE
jgi:hypothetical protein